MNDPVLEVQLLGGFSLRYGGRELPAIPSRPAASLLAFLILRRDRPQTRDLLAGRFWSELAEDKARRQLSHALWLISSKAKEAGLPAVGWSGMQGRDRTTVYRCGRVQVGDLALDALPQNAGDFVWLDLHLKS